MQSSLLSRTAKAVLLTAATMFVTASVVTGSANAKAVDMIEPVAQKQSAASVVQVAATTRKQARDARRAIRDELRGHCRSSSSSRRERRSCMHDARDTMRGLRNEAKSEYKSCRKDGGSKADCRDQRRAYWVNENGGGGGSTDTGGDTTGDRGDD